MARLLLALFAVLSVVECCLPAVVIDSIEWALIGALVSAVWCSDDCLSTTLPLKYTVLLLLLSFGAHLLEALGGIFALRCATLQRDIYSTMYNNVV